ncbi:MAG: restriction endonuclease subunit S [Cyanobacteria bacterium J06633_8]
MVIPKSYEKVKLKNIASIRLGYPFRTKIERNPEGTVGVIQMKDIDDYNCLDLSDVYKVQLDDAEKHLLHQHDILFCSRGVSKTTALVTEDIKPYVAALSLMVIRVKSKKVDPAYLVSYLNQPYGQYQISRISEGTSLSMVSKSALENLVINLPSLEKQKLIAEISALSQREQQIMEKLAQKRKLYIDTILMRKAVNTKHLKQK